MNLIARKYRSFLYHLRFKKEQLFDLVHGVDFSAPLTRTEAGVAEVNGSFHYCCTGYSPALTNALKFSGVTNKDAILDYGSGKGAMLLIFKKYPFRRIAGIEYSEKLIKLSEENFRKLNLSQFEIFHGDASNFHDLDDFNYFYLGNPFGSPVLEKVLANISASFVRKSRRIIIIYYHPLDKDPQLNARNFPVLAEFKDGTRVFKVYTVSVD